MNFEVFTPWHSTNARHCHYPEAALHFKQKPTTGHGRLYTTAEQLHLKTYFTRLEAQKEGCYLFLPPGNTIGMSQQDWKKLLEELK